MKKKKVTELDVAIILVWAVKIDSESTNIFCYKSEA